MTHPEQTTLLAEFYAEKKNVLKLKGEDYANEDVLSNFKTAGANIGISAELQCLSLIATKVARLGNLLSGKTPNNESVADSILDLSNYTDLLYCLVNEKAEQKKHLVEIMQSDEKDGLYELRTKRWENIAPYPMLDAIGDLHNTILAGAEFHKKRRENEAQEKINKFKPTESIKDTYVPKVGDRFKDVFSEIWEITRVEKLYCILLNDADGDMNQVTLSHEELQTSIADGDLKKAN